jgi:hypothetical protein
MSLKRLVGIEFEYKRELQEFLSGCLANTLVLEYDTGGNTPTSRTALYDKFVTCGPSMGFSTRQFAYGVLELVVEALVNNPDVPEDPYSNLLNDQLVNITRYVGIAGEGDFHFMVAVYNLSETLSEILGDVSPVGPIATLGNILTPGSGYSVGEDDTLTGVEFILSLADPESDQYEAAKVIGNIEDGEVVLITSISDPGDGFAANDTGVLVIDDEVEGQEISSGSGATVSILTVS